MRSMADQTPALDADPKTERTPLHYLIIDRLTQPQFLLALVSTLFLYWMTRQLIFGRVPDQMREVISVLVGFVTGQMVGPGWQFYFGTTQGSEKKTVALADNAAQLRRAGDLGGSPEPRPVVIEQPPGQPVPVAPEPRDPLRFQPPEDPSADRDLELPPRPGDS